MKRKIGFLFLLSIGLASCLLPALAIMDNESEMTAVSGETDAPGERKEVIDLQIRIYEVMGDQNKIVRVLAEPGMRSENGKSTSFTFGSNPESFISIDILPVISEGREINLKITARFQPGMDKPFENELPVKNGSSAIVKLFWNEKEKSWIVAQITPRIGTVFPAKPFPQPVTDFDWGETMVLVNDRLVARGKMEARNAEAFLLHSKEHGRFYFSFHPFPGSKMLGMCEGNSIKIPIGEGAIVEWFTSKPPLPEGQWPVWASRWEEVIKTPGHGNAEVETFGVTKNGSIGICRWTKADEKASNPEVQSGALLDEKMDFQFKNATFKNILDFLTRVLKVKLSLDPKLNEQRITCEFFRFPVRQFLDFACKQIGAKWRLEKGDPPVLKVESL